MAISQEEPGGREGAGVDSGTRAAAGQAKGSKTTPSTASKPKAKASTASKPKAATSTASKPKAKSSTASKPKTATSTASKPRAKSSTASKPKTATTTASKRKAKSSTASKPKTTTPTAGKPKTTTSSAGKPKSSTAKPKSKTSKAANSAAKKPAASSSKKRKRTTKRKSDGRGLGDLIGEILARKQAGEDDAVLAPLLERLAAGLGLSKGAADAVLSYLLRKHSVAQKASPTRSAGLEPFEGVLAEPPGLDELASSLTGDPGEDRTLLLSSGAAQALSVEAGLDPDSAADAVAALLHALQDTAV